MNNKYIIIALAAAFGVNSASGMHSIKGLVKPAFMASLVAGSSYAVGSQLKCDSIAHASGTIPGKFDEKKYPNLAKFVVMHRCSSELEAHRDQHFLKGDQIDRIINAERMKSVIEQEKLDLLEVPHKCLAKKSDGDYEVLSKKIERQNPENNELSLVEVQQLFEVSQITGFIDWSSSNVMRSLSGKIAFCDLEDGSFMSRDLKKIKSQLSDAFSWSFLTGYMTPVFRFNDDVKKWIINKHKELESSFFTGNKSVRALKINRSYDKKIDFEKVKQELADLKRP